MGYTIIAEYKDDMEVDRDAVQSSPNSVPSSQRRRNQFFPPLPVVPDSIGQCR